jgi:hypothetical protein
MIGYKKREANYRLEFNEKQQKFHLDNYLHEENTHNWFTIFNHCTDREFKIYEAFVNRSKKNKLTKEYLLKCAVELKGFTNNLLEYNLSINKV